MERLNRLLLKKESYSPEDLPTALRIGSTLWAMGMAIAILLLPLSPPDEAIGGPSIDSLPRASRRSSRSG